MLFIIYAQYCLIIKKNYYTRIDTINFIRALNVLKPFHRIIKLPVSSAYV